MLPLELFKELADGERDRSDGELGARDLAMREIFVADNGVVIMCFEVPRGGLGGIELGSNFDI